MNINGSNKIDILLKYLHTLVAASFLKKIYKYSVILCVTRAPSHSISCTHSMKAIFQSEMSIEIVQYFLLILNILTYEYS